MRLRCGWEGRKEDESIFRIHHHHHQPLSPFNRREMQEPPPLTRKNVIKQQPSIFTIYSPTLVQNNKNSSGFSVILVSVYFEINFFFKMILEVKMRSSESQILKRPAKFSNCFPLKKRRVYYEEPDSGYDKKGN